VTAAPLLFENTSKFYGDVLGINRVDLEITPGITGLVGPNGSGKTTLMNLAAGLLRPTRGAVALFGESPAERPDAVLGRLGYCTQFDTFPRGMSGFDFVDRYLRLRGVPARESRRRSAEAIDSVGMTAAASRRIAGYSKGMKQRIKLAQAIVHDPDALILDEPLNGLDPLARAEVLQLLRTLSAAGKTILVSSHILHEVDDLADRVVLIHGGYIVAEGAVEGVRNELAASKPIQVLVRCDQPARLAARFFAERNGLPPGARADAESSLIVEARIDDDRRGVLVRTENAEHFYRLINRLAADGELSIDAVLPADEDVQAVYRYLIRGDGDLPS
jgi:ABC-2 type transport system ATP-binding protein